MPFDACSRLEYVKLNVFKKNQAVPAPLWARRLVERIASDLDLVPFAPSVYFTTVECSTTYGGRWFPDRNAIVIIAFPSDRRVEKATVVHEMGHWLRFVRGGDAPGEHDARWQEVMRDLYPKYGVPISNANELDRASGVRWGDRW